MSLIGSQISAITGSTNTPAFVMNGSLSFDQSLQTIQVLTETPLTTPTIDPYSLQILMPVSALNNALRGTTIAIDPSGGMYQWRNWDGTNEKWIYDSVVIDASDIAHYISPTNVSNNNNIITSLGRFALLYVDFQRYVRDYFSFTGGYESLFVIPDEYTIDPGNKMGNSDTNPNKPTVAASNTLIEPSMSNYGLSCLLNGVNPINNTGTGAAVDGLTGSLTLSNITQNLRAVVSDDTFANRNVGKLGLSSTYGNLYPLSYYAITSTDASYQNALGPSYEFNWGVEDGFVPGDVLYLPPGTGSGINFKMSLGITDVDFQGGDIPGPTLVKPTTEQSSSTTNNYNGSVKYTASSTLINVTYNVGLVIRLVEDASFASVNIATIIASPVTVAANYNANDSTGANPSLNGLVWSA
jgi:hypothetical protein